jgi:tartrate/fumarate subfamily iron-sulfur-dependent hydro-lyase beta chain
MIHRLIHPFTREQTEPLQAGDGVRVSGLIYTGRDRLHKFLFEGGASPVPLGDGGLYHCGPVMIREGAGWQAVAAGPTTSIREEPYMARILREHGVRVVIGKGGMGTATAKACQDTGSVYLEAVGGAAQVLASCIVRVRGVHFESEFGSAEAMWELEVADFPALVSIDVRGVNLHHRIEHASQHALARLLANDRKDSHS